MTIENELFSVDQACLLVIDVQGHLAERVHDSQQVIKKISMCIRMADILSLPTLYTEQVPEKLGRTTQEIFQLLNGRNSYTKSTFSALGTKLFEQDLRALGRRQVIVVGIETHVCVFQTTVDLLQRGYRVAVVSDAVSSRHPDDRAIALERMKAIGGTITSTEMLATELIRGAEHPRFKDILALIK